MKAIIGKVELKENFDILISGSYVDNNEKFGWLFSKTDFKFPVGSSVQEEMSKFKDAWSMYIGKVITVNLIADNNPVPPIQDVDYDNIVFENDYINAENLEENQLKENDFDFLEYTDEGKGHKFFF